MPNQSRPLTPPAPQKFQTRELPEDYYIEKGLASNPETDVRLQEQIWDFLGQVPGLDLSEIEVDVSDCVVTLMGTFTDPQIQGRVVHNIMNFNGVRQVKDQTHLIQKHPQMQSSDRGTDREI